MVTFICAILCLFYGFISTEAANREWMQNRFGYHSFVVAASFVFFIWFLISTFSYVRPPFGIGYKEKTVDYFYNHMNDTKEKIDECHNDQHKDNECLNAYAASRRFYRGY